MIPKTIHYCWLSDEPFPRKIMKCMDTWRKILPDYEIKRWSTENFDIDAVPYVKQAFEARKWAFAADYIRMYALYNEGGIYLDSDVMVLKPFDDFLDNAFFSSMEYHPIHIEKHGMMQYIDDNGRRIADRYIEGIQIQAAVMGAEKGCQFVGDVLEWYKDKHFIDDEGNLMTSVISPLIYARVAEKLGFVYKDIDQRLPGRVRIYPSETFAGNKYEATPNSYAIHMCAHSWHLSPMEKIRKWLGIKQTYTK